MSFDEETRKVIVDGVVVSRPGLVVLSLSCLLALAAILTVFTTVMLLLIITGTVNLN